jgi:hypothetical protein
MDILLEVLLVEVSIHHYPEDVFVRIARWASGRTCGRSVSVQEWFGPPARI